MAEPACAGWSESGFSRSLMPPNTFPTSALTLGTLADADTPALLDLRPMLGAMTGPGGSILRDAFERIQQAVDNLQQTLRSNSPSLQYLQIDAADIAVLAVGGEFGPGEFTVYNGPPDYAAIGWIGSRAKATTVNLTSIVAGLVTSAAPHLLKVGDNVYIEATTDPLNTGFYVVATRPSGTTFTVTGGVASGNSTGGTMTKQFQGEWVKMFAAGGTAFDDAPLQVDVDGALAISDAIITVVHLGTPTTTVLIDPGVDGISVFDDSPIAAITKVGPRSVEIKATAGGDASDALMFAGGGVAGFSASDVTALVRMTYRTDLGLKLYDAAGVQAFWLDDTTGLSVTKDVDVSGVYRKGGVAGVSGSQNVVVSVSPSTATLQYKDWAGANQSLTVVTGVSVSASARAYSGGIRTV